MNQLYSKMSTKGQVVIPADIRKLMNLKSGDYLVFEVEDDKTIRIKKGKLKIVKEDDG